MELDAATIKSVTDQQTGRLVRESQHECLLGAAGVLIGALALRAFTSELVMATWAGLGLAAYGIRYLLARRARSAQEQGGDSSEIFPAFAISLAVTGVLWGAAFAWSLRGGVTVLGAPFMLLGLAIVMLSVGFHAGTPKVTRLFVAADSASLLSECVLDYEEELTHTGFKIVNPKAKQTCGCGTSFEA